MNRLQIRGVQLFFAFMLAIGIENHVITVPLVLHAAKRDAWISALLSIPTIVIWAIVVGKVMHLTNRESLFGWFKSRYNKFIACLVLLPFLFMLGMELYITVRDSCTWTKVTYLPKTPYFITVGVFVLTSMAGAMKGLRTIVIASGVLLPGVIILGFFVMTVNFQFKDYDYLLPILAHGYKPAFHGMLYILSGMIEMSFVLTLKQYLSSKIKIGGLVVATIIITGLAFGPLVASIAIFGPYEASDQRYPAFEQWRMVLIGKFISHLDFLSIYQWLSGSLIRNSLALFMIIDLIGLTNHRLKTLWMTLLSFALIFAVTRIKISDASFFNFLQAVYYPVVSIFFYVFPFLLLMLVTLKRRSGAHEASS